MAIRLRPPCVTVLPALFVLVLAACGPGENPTVTSYQDGEVQQAVTTAGNWSGFGSGQCVSGVYTFYENRFGVNLTGCCAQPGNVGICENCGACMIWESGAVQPNPALFNRYDWGTTMPQTYDIVVYPPRGGTLGYGHVACVDHLESSDPGNWGALYVMDSNYLVALQTAAYVHTVSRAPYGLYRLKSLDHQSAAPHGYLDTASCDGVTGWAQDNDAASQSINVDVYWGGVAGSGVPGERLSAGISRADLCSAIGSCTHGFAGAAPRALMDGADHAVHAYGIDGNGSNNAELSDSPRTLNCAVSETGVRRHIGSPAVLSAWGFDTFYDLRPVSDAAWAGYAQASAWPDTRQVIKGEGDSAVYVVDGSYKRHVTDPTSAAAWHIDLGAVTTLPLDQVQAMPEGPPLRARPALIKASGDAVDVLDDPLPGDVLPDPDGGDLGQQVLDDGGTTAVEVLEDGGARPLQAPGAETAPAGEASAPTVLSPKAGEVLGSCSSGGAGTGVLSLAAVALLGLARRGRRG